MHSILSHATRASPKKCLDSRLFIKTSLDIKPCASSLINRLGMRKPFSLQLNITEEERGVQLGGSRYIYNL